MKKLKIGYIGLGRRGQGVLSNSITKMDDVEVVYICDLRDECIENAKQIFIDAGKPVPAITKDYKEVLASDEVEAVFIMTHWNNHATISKESILAGKYTAVEVGCVSDIQECYDLLNAYETTKVPFMMLENACYDRKNLMVQNIARQGLFGDIAHCTCGYRHYLPRVELFVPNEDDPDAVEPIAHYRIEEYIHRNCEQYPTHGLGPVSKLLNINRGNRMVKLVSVSSKSIGLEDYARRNLHPDSRFNHTKYNQGDIINTIITCANGETIGVTLDTTLPGAFFSENGSVRGTRGLYEETAACIYFDDMEQGKQNKLNMDSYYEKYEHPLYKKFKPQEEEKGHSGIDFLTCRAFIEAAINGTDTPITAYDSITWMAIGALSEQSILTGQAVEIPDFTRGKWIKPNPPIESKYCLDKVCEEE